MVEGAADPGPRRFPGRALQQHGARVGPLLARGDEEVAAPERGLDLLQHGERVRPAIHMVVRAVVGVDDAGAPRLRDSGERRLDHVRRVRILQRGQEGEGREEGTRACCPLEMDGAQHRGQEAPHRRVLCQDFALVVIIGRTRQVIDGGDGGVDGRLTIGGRDHGAHVGVAIAGVAHDAGDIAQDDRRRVEGAHGAQALLFVDPVLRKLSPATIWRQMGNRPMTLLYSACASPIESRE